jgi:formylglycine-generating enzyme required for sulfatase activity
MGLKTSTSNRNIILGGVFCLLFLIIVTFFLIRNASKTADSDTRKAPATVATQPQSGRLQITAIPGDATIYINGKRQGQSPIIMEDRAYGVLAVYITKPGYKDHSEDIRFSPETPQPVSFTLIPLSGRLEIKSDPSGAAISINGTSHGTTPLVMEDFPVGPIEITLTKGCFETLLLQEELVGEDIVLNGTMKYTCGNLELRSKPSGASIFVGGRKLGTTPRTLTGVLCGERDFVLKKKGYRDKKKRIHIQAGKTAIETLYFARPLKPQDGMSWIEPRTDIDFAWLSGGCYQMGSPESEKLRLKYAKEQKNPIGTFFSSVISVIADSEGDEEIDDHDIDESPVHEVCVKGHWIASKEITNKQFALFSKQSGIVPEWKQKGTDFGIGGEKNEYYKTLGGDQISQDSRPVVGISWQDTQKFVQWFSKRSGYQARLLTEAEWEYACRSGGKDEEFSGDSSPGQVAWCAANSDNESHDVGQLQPNGVGLYDMSGNVWEWVQDTYDADAYEKHARQTPLIQVTTEKHARKVVRGGSWHSKDNSLRCTSRYGLPPDDRHVFLGFRITLDEKKQ